ncbi:MAG: hypothetical protein JNL67_03770 [Planctomycetaceae bacterium]|nr:hypothetical protein [Planctomycetaceae bacterium]
MIQRAMFKFCQVVWASPNSLLGILIGLLGMVAGGRMRYRAGCLEFWGGGVAWGLRSLPIRPVAMALGHVILGVDSATLERVGPHERIHVRQYERWGPFFIPAYGLASWWVWQRGLRAYRDNPFEVEAYNDDERRAALAEVVASDQVGDVRHKSPRVG